MSRERLFCKQRFEFILHRELRRFSDNFALMSTLVPCKQRQKSEDTRVGGRSKRERCKRVSPPAETTYDVARVTFHRLEGSVQRLATKGVIDYIEALSGGVFRNIVLHRRVPVDRCRTKGFNQMPLVIRDRSEDLRP